jgi:anti-anti-sigma factor
MRPLGSSFFTVPGRPALVGETLGTGPTIVWLQGEHDIGTDKALRRILARAIALNDAPLVLDLSKANLISGSTIGVIVSARSFLGQRSRSLTLRCPSAQVRRVIGICGLDDLFETSPGDHDSPGGPGGPALVPRVTVPKTSPAGRISNLVG